MRKRRSFSQERSDYGFLIIDIIVELNSAAQKAVKYKIRLGPSVQTPEQTLEKALVIRYPDLAAEGCNKIASEKINFAVAKPRQYSIAFSCMKKLLVAATTLCILSGFTAADIHSPPGSHYTSGRKLGRAFSNILYGFIEIPEQIVRKSETHGAKAGWSYGVVDGTSRGLHRLGYGFYELITFNFPTYRGTFKPPYEKCGQDNRVDMNVLQGLSEFPPELGSESYYRHSRTQSF